MTNKIGSGKKSFETEVNEIIPTALPIDSKVKDKEPNPSFLELIRSLSFLKSYYPLLVFPSLNKPDKKE